MRVRCRRASGTERVPPSGGARRAYLAHMSSSNRLGDALGLGGDDSQDRRTILAGTGQNVIGLGIFVIASFGMNILIAQAFGKGSAAFGQNRST